jgi:hypothetical protein
MLIEPKMDEDHMRLIVIHEGLAATICFSLLSALPCQVPILNCRQESTAQSLAPVNQRYTPRCGETLELTVSINSLNLLS